MRLSVFTLRFGGLGGEVRHLGIHIDKKIIDPFCEWRMANDDSDSPFAHSPFFSKRSLGKNLDTKFPTKAYKINQIASIERLSAMTIYHHGNLVADSNQGSAGRAVL
ncbi:MAG: hypothetical protein DPW09_38230 [Anaerolineae bacterium]|nr:hypothetical protein [Anaerolineae bacterium]